MVKSILFLIESHRLAYMKIKRVFKSPKSLIKYREFSRISPLLRCQGYQATN